MDMALVFGYAAIAVFSLLIGYFITRWYHSIPRRLRLQEAEYFLIMKLAEKAGVEAEDINKSLSHAQGWGSLLEELKKK